MLIAGLDFETTSLDTETCFPTEIAIVLWEPIKNAIVESLSFLITVPEDYDITNSHITGINKELVNTHGFDWKAVEPWVIKRLSEADYLMAHHVPFDRPILKRLVRWNSYAGEKPFSDETWIDSRADIAYPSTMRHHSLVYLAADHGFLNPFPHRALFDVMTMIKIVSQYDINEIIKCANSKSIWIRAGVTMEDRQMAKERRYLWDPINKFWVREIKEMNLEREEKEAGFSIDLLPGYVYKEQYL